LRRVIVNNYKSIGNCDVKMTPFTVLVGRNGAGKSNFLDALRFVTDSLLTSLDHAIKSRGGIQMVRRKSTGHPRDFSIELEFNLTGNRLGKYGFEITARPERGFTVKWEKLQIMDIGFRVISSYVIEDGELRGNSDESIHPTLSPAMPKVVPDRLYLVVASGIPAFREAYDSLTSMGFYNLNPESMKELQAPDAGELLHRDGDNVASVIARLETEAPEDKARVEQYLSRIVPGVEAVKRQTFGPRETVEFRQRVRESASGQQNEPWRFPAASMSDGTLRALGLLVAVSQLVHLKERVLLVGVEEPETALHPAAAKALMDALREAQRHTQIIITTHSADLLDNMGDSAEGLLAVQSKAGETQIAPIDSASRIAVKDHLYTAGEMLRMDQLEPDESNLQLQQSSLFGSSEKNL
jgi:predicted ATPase